MKLKILNSQLLILPDASAGILTSRRNNFQLKCFTLVELMIVIGIMGILAAISVSFLNPLQLQKKARDSVRLRDINTLKSTIVLALQNGGTFLGRCTSTNPCNSLDLTQKNDGAGYVDLDLSGYLTQLPVDPLKNSGSFTDASGVSVPAAYEFAEQNGNFEIRIHLESKDNLSRYTDDGGNNSGYYEIGTKLDIL